MKEIVIASFDMEVGGVERSLISMLDNFDYSQHKIDLMLYRHQGDFLHLLPGQVNLLAEVAPYTTFRKTIKEVWLERQFSIGFVRLLAKLNAFMQGKIKKIEEPGYLQMQLMWKYALTFLPRLSKQYDVAISYLWPHYFIAEKVQAKTKIAWIHTDYSTVDTNEKSDLKMWDAFDHIIAVSQACGNAFLQKYNELERKLVVIENINSPALIRSLAKENIKNQMKADYRFKILTVARLSHAKGIDRAIRALKKLRDQGHDKIVWYVVGYGGDEHKLQALIAEYKLEAAFILLGKQINPYPFMKAADLYVQPSRYEGKAVTVREAQILAKAVLITNYATAQSQVTDGIDGRICEQTVEGIAEGILNLYKNPEERKCLEESCANANYENHSELKKLYEIV